jgi:hypothetical protein
MLKSYFQGVQLFLWEFLNQNGNVQDSKAWESWEFVILIESTLLIIKYIVVRKWWLLLMLSAKLGLFRTLELGSLWNLSHFDVVPIANKKIYNIKENGDSSQV